MVLIKQTPKLKVNNQLCMLIQTFDEEMGIEQLTKQKIVKMQFIYGLHKSILDNNAHTHMQHKKTYALQKGK